MKENSHEFIQALMKSNIIHFLHSLFTCLIFLVIRLFDCMLVYFISNLSFTHHTSTKYTQHKTTKSTDTVSLRKGTIVNKRHAPIWQAWGVLETRHGNPEDARDIFQQGIWACAQSSGGQSGGRRCARLWQAWGVLESQEEDYDAARRCFSRALDADSWNVAAVTAWTVMEKNLGNYKDARLIYERRWLLSLFFCMSFGFGLA